MQPPGTSGPRKMPERPDTRSGCLRDSTQRPRATAEKETPMPTLFVSLFAYAAAKHAETVKRSWPEWVAFWRANPASSPWLGFRSLAEATARGEETQDYVSGAVLVTKARSKAAGLFLSSGADVWLTLDDDVFVDGGIIHRLLTACRETRAIV